MSTTSPVSSSPARQKVTTRTFRQKKLAGEHITMLTAYDYMTATVVEQAGIDALLVGDSLGMVVLGYETTLPVTMADMLHHCKAVARGARTPLLVGDMPFMSYQASVEEAVRNAGRFLQEGGMDAVKLEGGRERADVVRAITAAGIPVMGHIGLTPQSVALFGGFVAQGKTAEAAHKLVEDALALQDAGCFSIVLETVPDQLAGLISSKLEIPTIGIGAGPNCDGQVLVIHDMLGLYDRFTPKFVRQYARLYAPIVEALESYRDEVIAGQFPAHEHGFTMKDEEWTALQALLAPRKTNNARPGNGNEPVWVVAKDPSSVQTT
ncbi:MAG: 3-methyl-2-oxobutanoate hydroxymethyltransferase [Anaerolineae bacterium]|nr:3-methyl-2-oxobutanoate hydroxymethyltransferase [Anaerolineae bacterium]MCB0205868.1 3-methyl-2-oxobutanoate hydroxymethyltransferase [Anaerolineae bacterium]MCB0256020.1 3-methyl-2-oxobutanoate hydroxymethyltransferase [Anaerolineae bacterium]